MRKKLKMRTVKAVLFLFTLLITHIADAQSTNMNNGHEYVDLGLPSGTLWATCNVGANRPENNGNYYAWGETATKSTYSWKTYKYCRGDFKNLTKYNTKSDYGTVDNKKVLGMTDDVARVNWGGDWRMPTYDEMNELKSKCIWTWTTQGGKSGYKVKGSNGRSIFLPAAGYYCQGKLNNEGSYGNYWSSSLGNNDPNGAYNWHISSGEVGMYLGHRYYGQTIRPVLTAGTVTEKATNNTQSDISTDQKKTPAAPDRNSFSVSSETSKIYGHGFVDLGLPSGTLWATCNLGADRPEDYGDYKRWTGSRGYYYYKNYHYLIEKYCTKNEYSANCNRVDNKVTLEMGDDVANDCWGGSWRTPTYKEMNELKTMCTWTWTTQRGKNGYLVTGRNGKSIFLPAAGIYHASDKKDQGSYGYYWSSSLFPDYPYDAYNLYFSNDGTYILHNDRSCSMTIRPVCSQY